MTAPAVRVVPIGAEARPIAVIDDFAADPAGLRAAASAVAFGPALHHYPGVRAPVPADYWPAQQPVIAAALAAVLKLRGTITLIDASYAIVTTPRAALSVSQRLPHCDAFDADRIALVHYLAPDDGDGTAFYRHRATGFEAVDRARAPIYLGQLEAELRHGAPPPAGYVGADDPRFERIAVIPPRDNRALLYRSYQLHSGAIAPDAALHADPRRGRLTITAFFSIG